MKLSILVPVYNEENTIKAVLEKLLSVRLPWKKEIIVIDDGSTDQTGKIIKNYELRTKNFEVILHTTNLGKGEAIKSGIKAVTGDYILIQDADLEYNPEEIKKLLKPILSKRKSGKVAVYGSRFKHKQVKISPIYYLGNMFLTFLTNFLYKTKLTDMETGYKLLPTKFMRSTRLISHNFDIEPEITAKLILSNIPIIEVPISYKGRSHLAGKKLTIADAFAAIKILVCLKFTS